MADVFPVVERMKIVDFSLCSKKAPSLAEIRSEYR